MGWGGFATILIMAVVMIGAFISVIETALFKDEEYFRRMGAFSDIKLDCRNLNAREWISALMDEDEQKRGNKVPIRAFAFADYNKASEIECDGDGSVIDYGIAIGYAKPGHQVASYQVSYVLRSETVKNAKEAGEDGQVKREQIIHAMTRMLVAVSEKTDEFSGVQVEEPFIAKKATRFFSMEAAEQF